jgi:hypothetical protein
MEVTATWRRACWQLMWLGATLAADVAACKTPDFHRKPESLYHRDSPWISGYRVQNVLQIITQSHTLHHIGALVHNLLHVHYGLHHYKPLG